MGVLETVTGTLSEAKQLVTENKSTILVGAGSAAVGAVLGAGAVALTRRKKTKRRKKSKSSHSRRRSRKSHVHKKRKGKYTSHKRIHYTKTGQPYIILRSGKARFITKRGAKQARKRKGGRY